MIESIPSALLALGFVLLGFAGVIAMVVIAIIVLNKYA